MLPDQAPTPDRMSISLICAAECGGMQGIKKMIFNQSDYDEALPLPPTEKWKDGVWDIEVFKHGRMSILYFAPEGTDFQTPHDQDEVYVVLEGSGDIEIDGVLYSYKPGSTIFVKAGQTHRFVGNLTGVKMWVILYGPIGGETDVADNV